MMTVRPDFGDLAEKLHYLFLGRRIETGCRLIQEDHRWFSDQLNGDRNTFSLAA